MLPSALQMWEEPSREESYSSVSVESLGIWCDGPSDESESQNSELVTKESEHKLLFDEADKVRGPRPRDDRK